MLRIINTFFAADNLHQHNWPNHLKKMEQYENLVTNIKWSTYTVLYMSKLFDRFITACTMYIHTFCESSPMTILKLVSLVLMNRGPFVVDWMYSLWVVIILFRSVSPLVLPCASYTRWDQPEVKLIKTIVVNYQKSNTLDNYCYPNVSSEDQ